MRIRVQEDISLLLNRYVVPNRDRNERSTLFPNDARIQALESMDNEHDDVRSNSPRQSVIEAQREHSTEETREIVRSVIENIYSAGQHGDVDAGRVSVATYPMFPGALSA